MHSLNTFSAIALAVGALLSASPAWAQDTETASSAPSASSADGSAQARAWYERGVKLALEKRFLEAQVEFERALRKDPPLEAYFGMGQVELALGRPCEALDAYSKYLELGGIQVPEEKRRGVENHMRQLRQGGGSEESCHPEQRRGTLFVQCDQKGVSLQIDGRSFPIDKEYGHRLAAGSHQAVFSDQAGEWEPVVVEVIAGSTHHLACVPRPAAVEGSSGSRTASGADGLNGGQVSGLVVGGTGLGVAVAALGHFFWNHGRHDVWKREHDELLEQGGSIEDKEENNELNQSIERASRVTVGLAIAGGVLTGMGVTIYVLSSKKKSPQDAGQVSFTQTDLVRAGSSSLRTSISARVTSTSAALQWSGAW